MMMDGEAKSNPINLNDRSDITEIEYGFLYHLLGENKIALQMLNHKRLPAGKNSKSFKEIADMLSTYIELSESYNSIKVLSERVMKKPEHLAVLLHLYDALSSLIKSTCVYKETGQYDRRYFQYRKEIPDKTEAQDRVRAIFLYTLRSHCSFWLEKPLTINKITDSKRSLNDLFQAERLLKDLLYGFHLMSKDGLYSTIQDKIKIEKEKPRELSYASLLSMIHCVIYVLKGSIYKKSNFYENALDSFFGGIRLYNKAFNVDDNLSLIKTDDVSCFPIIMKAHFEVSKLLFEKGKVIQSLSHLMDSLIHLLAISNRKCTYKSQGESINNSIVKKDDLEDSIPQMIETMDVILEVRKVLRSMANIFREYLHKDLILGLFLDRERLKELYELFSRRERCSKQAVFPDITARLKLVNPQLFSGLESMISPDLKPVLADILARLGFIIYTIRINIQLGKITGQKNFSSKHDMERLNNAILDEINKFYAGYDGYEPELGVYSSGLTSNSPQVKNFFSRKIERVFSSVFWAHSDKKKGKISELKPFCNELARHSLINIGNISSIPVRVSHYLSQDGYKTRTRLMDKKSRSKQSRSLNKFVILRRWQSFNPKVPRPKGQDIRGGGNFLFWNGKGIVIDPGYNFIQNFFEEGFSIEDIDAVLVTHAHPDHEDELNTILTLVEEWNQVQEVRNKYIIKPDEVRERKYLDLFLNEGAYRKYSSWLHAEKIRVAKIFLLQSSMWDKRSTMSTGNNRKPELNPIIDLMANYSLKLEVIPAWHNQLIDKYSSVGIIFHLCSGLKTVTKLGITGDTEFFNKALAEKYKSSDILVAHLGDIKFPELLAFGGIKDTGKVMHDFVDNWFKPEGVSRQDKMNMLLDYVIGQNLLAFDIKSQEDGKSKDSELEKLIDALKQYVSCESKPRMRLKGTEPAIDAIKAAMSKTAFKEYQYKNHLGLFGIYNLHDALMDNGKHPTKVFIVGELPEELQSYRHIVSCLLNERGLKKKVVSFTGDIGLHLGLPTEGIRFLNCNLKERERYAIRCMKCNQNNELIDGIHQKTNLLSHYHNVSDIQETAVKALDSRIIWLCQNCHAAGSDVARHEYFLEPDIKPIY